MKNIYKSNVIKEKHNFNQKLYNQLEDMTEDNPKEYWELFDKLKKNCHDNRNNMDCPINDKEWIDHYVKLSGPKIYNKNRLDNIELEISKLLEQDACLDLNQPITNDEIFKASKGLKKNKAVVLDQISNEMIGRALPVLCNALKRLFNSIL